MKYLSTVLLTWTMLLLYNVANAEPKDFIQPETETPPQVFQSEKPVTCTTDAYDEVKQNFLESHGEVGFMRYVSDRKTAVEIIGNPDTGTITILEFIPSNEYTCFISVGKSLEVNSNVFDKAKQGIQPDISLFYNWNDYKNGKDTIIQWIVNNIK